MKNFKQYQQLMLYSLMILPTVLFLSVVLVGNNLIKNDHISTKQNIQLEHKEEAIFKEFISEEEKISWCNKRSECAVLSEMAYHEARGENDFGVVSVMHVTLNRVKSKHPIFKQQNSIRSVVYSKHQYSYVHDGSRARGMNSKKQSDRVKVLAYDVMNKLVQDTTDGSLYYHTLSVRPNWSKVYAYTYTVGNHKFYKHN